MAGDQAVGPIAQKRRQQRTERGEGGPGSSEIVRGAEHGVRFYGRLVAVDPQHRLDAFEAEVAAQVLSQRRVASDEEKIVTALVAQDELHRATTESAGPVVDQNRRHGRGDRFVGRLPEVARRAVVDEPERNRSAERIRREIVFCGDGLLVIHCNIDETQRPRGTENSGIETALCYSLAFRLLLFTEDYWQNPKADVPRSIKADPSG